MSPLLHTDLRNIDKDAVAARAAQLKVMNVGINRAVSMLTEEFGYQFKRAWVEKLETTETFQKVITEHQNSVVKAAVNGLKQATSKLIPKVVAALEQALDDGNIQAVPHVMKILGVESLEPEQKQAQSLTVVLPGRPKEEKDVTDK